MCGSTATSTTSVPTPAAPPAPVADMPWQPHHFIGPAPEEETPLPAAWPEAPPKAAAATTATAATTASQQPTANKHSSARGALGGIEPETFWIWSGLGGRGACALRGRFRRSKNPSHRHYQLQLGLYKQKRTTDKPSITKPGSTRHAGEAGGLGCRTKFTSMTCVRCPHGFWVLRQCNLKRADWTCHEIFWYVLTLYIYICVYYIKYVVRSKDKRHPTLLCS